MGLFGFLKTGLGNVAKFGASKLTHGLSDKVLSKIKSTGQKKAFLKAMAARQAATNQQAIAALKVTPMVTYGNSLRKNRQKIFRRDLLEAPVPLTTLVEKPGRGLSTSVPARRKKAGAKRAAAPAKKSGRRGPPSGGLDFVKISQMWKAQGQPGDWQSFIRQNTNVRKK